jgi:putative tricarboxylic transport membrane protein
VKTADRVGATLLLVVSVTFLLISRRFSPYSALFPRTIAVILGLLSLLLLLVSFARPAEGAVWGTLRGGGILPVAISIGLLAAWLTLIKVLGFLVASLVCFSFILVFLDRDRSGKAIVVRVLVVSAITIGFYLFFARLLMVPFPTGLLI